MTGGGYMAYGTFGSGLLAFAIVAALLIVPFWRLLPKFGLPAWLAVLCVFPLIALILLWVMAFRDRRDGEMT